VHHSKTQFAAIGLTLYRLSHQLGENRGKPVKKLRQKAKFHTMKSDPHWSISWAEVHVTHPHSCNVHAWERSTFDHQEQAYLEGRTLFLFKGLGGQFNA